jgi:hypothetical protein
MGSNVMFLEEYLLLGSVAYLRQSLLCQGVEGRAGCCMSVSVVVFITSPLSRVVFCENKMRELQ